MVTLVSAKLLRTEVASEITNAPNPVVDRSIVTATRMLCDEVALWQETANVAASGDKLDLTALETHDQEVVRVMPRGVSQAGTQLPQYNRPNPGTSAELGYYIRSRRELVLTQAPTTTDFDVVAQMRPSIQTDNVPEDVAHDYHDVIVHGALYRLFRMPSERWGSGEAALAHYEQFQAGIKRVRSEVPRVYVEQ